MKRVIVAGLLGWVLMIVWTAVVNGVFGFRSRIDMKRIPDERRVYEVLKESVVEPGRYVVNPEVSPARAFPGEEPVFSIHYSGVGHGFAGPLAVLQLAVSLLALMVAAWMLSTASERILSSYPRKVLFFASIGFLFAVFDDLMDFGIGGYPLSDALALAVHDVVVWTFVGLVVAWRIRPEPGAVTHS